MHRLELVKALPVVSDVACHLQHDSDVQSALLQPGSWAGVCFLPCPLKWPTYTSGPCSPTLHGFCGKQEVDV